jgi:hypothetical protein
MSSPKRGSVVVLVGTRKGAFLFRSDARRKSWAVAGPHFPGQNVFHFILDLRDPATLFAATYTEWWGGDVQRSRNSGRTWQGTKGGVRYSEDAGLSVKCVWHVRPGRASEPGVVYAGVFRSDDGARIWQPRNQGTRADFLPTKFPELGQCVHKLVQAHGSPPRALPAKPLRRLSRRIRRRFMGGHFFRVAFALRLSHRRASARAKNDLGGAAGECGNEGLSEGVPGGLSLHHRRPHLAEADPRPADPQCPPDYPARSHVRRLLRPSGDLLRD